MFYKILLDKIETIGKNEEEKIFAISCNGSFIARIVVKDEE